MIMNNNKLTKNWRGIFGGQYGGGPFSSEISRKNANSKFRIGNICTVKEYSET